MKLLQGTAKTRQRRLCLLGIPKECPTVALVVIVAINMEPVQRQQKDSPSEICARTAYLSFVERLVYILYSYARSQSTLTRAQPTEKIHKSLYALHSIALSLHGQNTRIKVLWRALFSVTMSLAQKACCSLPWKTICTVIFCYLQILTHFGWLILTMLLFFLQHSKSATYSVGMQKTYSLICLAMEEDKIDQTKKAPLKLPFLSWGTKNRQKAASTLCLPSAVAGSSQIKKKLSPFTLLNTESSLYWIFQKDRLTWHFSLKCI